MDGGVRITRDDIVHEVEEFDPAATVLVGGSDLTPRHVKGRKEGGSAIALVVMTMSGQSPAIWQFQVSLGALDGRIEGFSSTQITIAFSGAAI